MKAVVKRFIRGETGMEMAEYAVMTALITAALITAVGFIVAAVSARYTAAAAAMDP